MKALLTTLMITLIALAGHSAGVKVKFKVMDEAGAALKGATVKLYKMNQLVMVDEEAAATTKWSLDRDSYYTIEVSMAGFVTKRIGIYTRVNEDQLEENRFDFFVELESSNKYKQYAHPEDVLDYPSAIVEFKEDDGQFGANRTYWISTRRDFAALRASGQIASDD